MNNNNNQKSNNFFDLIKDLTNENKDFKKLVEEYSKEKKIIDEIVKQRKRKDLSQRDLAVLTGIKQPAIARLESMEVTPRIDTLLAILDALDLSFDIVDKEIKKQNYVFHHIMVDMKPQHYNNENNFYNQIDRGGLSHENSKLNNETRKNFT